MSSSQTYYNKYLSYKKKVDQIKKIYNSYVKKYGKTKAEQMFKPYASKIKNLVNTANKYYRLYQKAKKSEKNNTSRNATQNRTNRTRSTSNRTSNVSNRTSNVSNRISNVSNRTSRTSSTSRNTSSNFYSTEINGLNKYANYDYSKISDSKITLLKKALEDRKKKYANLVAQGKITGSQYQNLINSLSKIYRAIEKSRTNTTNNKSSTTNNTQKNINNTKNINTNNISRNNTQKNNVSRSDKLQKALDDLNRGVFYHGQSLQSLGLNNNEVNNYIRERNKKLIDKFTNIAKVLIKNGYKGNDLAGKLEHYMVGMGINPWDNSLPGYLKKGYTKLVDAIHAGIKKNLGLKTYSDVNVNNIKDNNNNNNNNQSNDKGLKYESIDISNNNKKTKNAVLDIKEKGNNVSLMINSEINDLDNKVNNVNSLLDNIANKNPDMKEQVDILKERINNIKEGSISEIKSNLANIELIESQVDNLTGLTKEQKQNIINEIKKYKQQLLNYKKEAEGLIKKYTELAKKGLSYRLGSYAKMLAKQGEEGKVGKGMAHAAYLNTQGVIDQELANVLNNEYNKRSQLANTLLNNYNAIVNQVKQTGAMYDPVIKSIIDSGYEDIKKINTNIGASKKNAYYLTNNALSGIQNNLYNKKLNELNNRMNKTISNLTNKYSSIFKKNNKNKKSIF